MTPRRLPDMQGPMPPWRPDLPAVGSYEQEFGLPGSASALYVVRLEWDARFRITEWAVVQLRVDGERRRRVVLFDTCHGKGVHVHYYDRSENEFRQELLWEVTSYADLDRGLDEAVARICAGWERYERRSTRGR